MGIPLLPTTAYLEKMHASFVVSLVTAGRCSIHSSISSHLISSPPSHPFIPSIQSRGSRNNPKEGGINLSSSRSSSRLISSHLIPSRPLSTPWCFHQTARSNFFLFFPFPPTEQEQCRKGPNKLLPNPERKGYIVRQKTPRKSPISPIPIQSISQQSNERVLSFFAHEGAGGPPAARTASVNFSFLSTAMSRSSSPSKR